VFVGRTKNTPDVELVSLKNGVEGRVWQDDVLRFSKFWPQKPAPEQWRLFLRGGSQPVAQVPDSSDLSYLQEPLNQVAQAFNIQEVFREKVIVTVALSVLSAVLVWQLTQVLLWQDAIEVANMELDKVNADVGIVLDARANALRSLNEIEAFNEVHGNVSLLSVFALVSAVISEESAMVEEFSHTGERLVVRISGTSKELTAYVEELEGEQVFTDVKATRGQQRDSVILDMSLRNSG
jgi:hypothetical protein